MPLLYEEIFKTKKLSPARKTYRIEFPEKIPEGTSKATGKITWDPARTTILGAYLEVTGVIHLWGATILTPVRGAIEAFVNGVSLDGYISDICTWECEYPFSFWKDCTPYIYNGENIIELKVYKSFGFPTGVEVKNMSVFMHLDYEGTEPGIEIKPPPPEWWKYVKWGMLGVGVIAIGATLIRVAPELMKKR